MAVFGTWVLNASRSNLGVPAPPSQLLVFRAFGAGGFFGVEDTTYADGTHTLIQFALKADGRGYPVNGAAAILTQADTVSLTMVDAQTLKWTYKKGPAVVLVVVGALAPDGLTLTLTTGDNRSLVYEKAS